MCRPWEYPANCPHGGARASLLATDSPLTAPWPMPRCSYSGEAAIPKRPHQEGTVAPPRSQSRFVVDLWAWCSLGPRGPRNGVGLSPVSVVRHCEQARPPYTPRAGGKNRDVLLRDGCSAAAWCFSTTGSLARRTRPDCDPSRSVLAWPLRHRPLLADAGCVPLRREFEQGFLDGHGPAQVGLGPPFVGPHRLRLSQQHLRLTQAAGAA